MSRPRLVLLDDGLFVRTQLHDIRPLAATFNRFVEAVARTGEFERVRYVVPVRDLRIWEVEPALDPIDESVLEVVPSTFFSGIADYLLRAGWVAGRNWPVIDRAIADADLLWLRLPASNGLLALAAARRHDVPHFGWLAGSAAQVARAQPRPAPLKAFARLIGAAYDAVSDLAGASGPMICLDATLFASVVSSTEVEQTLVDVRPVRSEGPWRLVWAGRMAGEKGLPELIEAVQRLRRRGRPVTLTIIGDGPARARTERLLAALPADAVEDYGYVGDRPSYMQLLRSGDLFAHPSGAEGVPKALVEAMAAGLPVIAADAGAVADVLGHGQRGQLVVPGNAEALADAIDHLLADAAERSRLRDAGLAWAADHTAEAQARRLVSWLRGKFPQLGWRP
jgi:glycosyltransferase involved in cell wall biosynthesis